jgi:hypothetical protein
MVTAVAATDIQRLIVLEVGDNQDGLLAGIVSLVWQSYADKAQIYPRLQELYSKRRLVDIALASERQSVDQSEAGTGAKEAQRFDHLIATGKRVDAEIALIEKQISIFPNPAVGTITKVEPIAPPSVPLPAGPLDGNDIRYGGSVYEPRPFPEGYL